MNNLRGINMTVRVNLVVTRKSFALGRYAGAIIAAFAAQTANCAEPSQSLCAEFSQLLNAPRGSGIDRRQLQISAQPGDEQQYYNLDIDGDDVNDVVKGGCSANLQPADPCILLIELASGKKIEFEFELDERFFLVRHRSKIYAVATAASEKRKPQRSVLRLDADGIARTCSGL